MAYNKMREWKKLSGIKLWLVWAICSGIVFLMFSPIFVPVIIQMTFMGWLFLAVGIIGGLIGAILLFILWDFVVIRPFMRIIAIILFGLSRLLPKRMKQGSGKIARRTISPMIALVIALRHGQIIPIMATVFIFIAVATALWQRRAVTLWLLSVAAAEVVVLALFAVAITMPALSITYRIAP